MNAYRLLIEDMIARAGWRLAGLLALMLLVGATEGFAAALLFSLLIRLGVSGASEAGSATATVENLLSWIEVNPGPWLVFTVLAVTALVQAVLFIQLSWGMSAMSRRYMAQWQTDLFTAFIRADWLFLTERKSGDLVNTIVVETGRLSSSFLVLAQLTAATMVTAVYLLIAFFVSWQVTLLLIGLTFVMILSILRLYRTSYKIGEQTGPFNSAMLTACSEYLSGVKIVKASGSEQRAIVKVNDAAENLQRVSRVSNFLPNLVRGMFELIGMIGLAALLVVGTSVLHVAAANLLVVLALFVRLLPRLIALQSQLHSLNTFAPAIITMNELLNAANATRERSTGIDVEIVQPATFSIEQLRIAYGERTVIDRLDLSFKLPGLYGIVGGSGAGKSTLMHAMVGLVPFQAGSIRLGEIGIQEASLTAWRKAIALVPQETVLFNSTIRDNLTIGRPDASMDDVIVAARGAHAHDFIMRLENGYDSFVGDQGVLLSGGQRQRLGIARALLAKPKLLLMDEPTSSLDPESEMEILATLDELRQSIGIVIVAHRLATVRNADRIFVLEKGAMVEEGSWRDLIGKQQRFYDLAVAQRMLLEDAVI